MKSPLHPTWSRLAASVALGAALIFPVAPGQGETVDSCTEAALREALATGGVVTFGCSGTIELAAPIEITNAVAFDATGRDVELVPAETGRIFEITSTTGYLALTNLVLSGGQSTNGGAIFNRGTVLLVSCVLSNNTARGLAGEDGRDSTSGGDNGGDGKNGGSGKRTVGGAVYNLGVLRAIESGFFGNEAVAGDGGDGGFGSEGEITGGDGGHGGAGGAAYGGAIFNQGFLFLTRCGFDGNAARGGNAGQGGEGGEAPRFSGVWGRGGQGGMAGGGAVYSTNKAVAMIIGCTFSENTVVSGQSAAGGTSRNSGKGGKAGPAAYGGGVCNYGRAEVLNSTFYENVAQGGNGGSGDNAELVGGKGGHGGSAWGGNLFNAGNSFVTNCTFAGGLAQPGTNGLGGSGRWPGANGGRGHPRGGNIGSGKGKFYLGHSILTNPPTSFSYESNIIVTTIVTNVIRIEVTNTEQTVCTEIKVFREDFTLLRTNYSCVTREFDGISRPTGEFTYRETNYTATRVTEDRSNAYGAIKDAGYNLISDRSIKFKKGSTSLVDVDPMLGPLASNGGPTETMEPTEGSPAIDGGAEEVILDTDQRGAARPAGEAGDIGAYEVDGQFDGPPSIASQPVDHTVLAGSNATFMVVASGTAPLSYQWFRAPDIELPGATSMTLTLLSVGLAEAGDYFVEVSNDEGSITSDAATLTVNQRPVAVSEPADAVADFGGNAAFAFGVAAHPVPAFRWYFNGTNLLAGATNAVLALTNVQSGQAGAYHAVATNSFGSLTSRVAALTIFADPPVALGQPADASAYSGETVTFAFPTDAHPAAAYRWWFNGTNLVAGASGPTLVLTNVQSAQAGTYQAIATNVFGSVTSRVATLTGVIDAAPLITLPPPAATNVAVGATLTLEVRLAGSLPMTFQWYFTDPAFQTSPVAGGTNATLVVPNFQPAHEGRYTLEAVNAFGSTFTDEVFVQTPSGAAAARIPGR